MPKTQPEAKEAQAFSISKIGNNYNQFMLFDDAVDTNKPIASVHKGEYVNILAAAPELLAACKGIINDWNGNLSNAVAAVQAAIRAAEPQSREGRE